FPTRRSSDLVQFGQRLGAGQVHFGNPDNGRVVCIGRPIGKLGRKQGFPGTVTAGKRKTGVTRLLLERGDQIRTEGAVAPAAVGGAIVIGSPATRTGRTVVGCRVLNGEYVFGRIRVVKIVVRSQDVIRIVDHIASQVRGLSVFPTVQVQTGHQRAGSP